MAWSRHCAALLVAMLAGCGTGNGNWVKPGADAATVEQEYRDCQALVAPVVRNEAAIDQDILATRQSDWQRAGIVRVETRTMQEQTRDRAAAIIASCMQAKGFSRQP